MVTAPLCAQRSSDHRLQTLQEGVCLWIHARWNNFVPGSANMKQTSLVRQVAALTHPWPAGSRKPMDRSTALTRARMDEPHRRGGSGDLSLGGALHSIIA